jgi:gluconokinase
MSDEIRVVVLAGVAGYGKMTAGVKLAARLGWSFADGGQFHPPANRRRMAWGLPLRDADRRLWLARLARLIAESRHLILACSASKYEYRQALQNDPGVAVVLLDCSEATTRARPAQRIEHSFGAPAAFITDQFATLEPPHAGALLTVIDAEQPSEQVVEAIVEALGLQVLTGPGQAHSPLCRGSH